MIKKIIVHDRLWNTRSYTYHSTTQSVDEMITLLKSNGARNEQIEIVDVTDSKEIEKAKKLHLLDWITKNKEA